MKPRSAREREVMKLHGKLPPISERQIRYAKENCFTKVGYITKGQVWCTMCGKVFEKKAPELGVSLGIEKETTCPFCGRTLDLKVSTKRKVDDSYYYTIVTTIQGWQVLRHFIVEKWMRKMPETIHGCSDPKYTINEVVQNWIDADGEDIVVARPRMGLMNGCYDKWIMNRPMEIRSRSMRYSYHPDPYSVDAYTIYPQIRVLPILRRNGLKGNRPNICMEDLIKLLLKDSRAETLMKIRQFALLESLNAGKGVGYWHSVLIAIRNKYIVKDAALWIDMLEALSYMDKDTHNAFFVCPKNLKEEHDKWVNLRRKKKQKIETERKRKQAIFWEEQYKKEKGRFFDLNISNGRVTIKTIQSVREMQEEGDFMHHCVATNEYYKKKDSLIMSAVDECGKRLETIEINLQTMKVVQCFGMYNKTTDRHQEILDVINGNMKEVIKANSCNYKI